MNNFMKMSVFVSILALVFSCQKKDVISTENNNECVFVQNDDDQDGRIDETERALMTECSSDLLTSRSEIENNLIGEWELIGHGQGWSYSPSQPCSYITISADELVFEFKNDNIDTTSTYSWGIEEVFWTGGQYFRLKTIPDYLDGLFLNQFCDRYMYGDATPADGNMYLYRKVD